MARIPASWTEITPEWFTDALSREHPGVEVARARLVDNDGGTNLRARFELDYERGSGPRTLFLKQHASENIEAHTRNGNLYVEAQLYESDVPLGARFPKIHKVVIDRTEQNFLVVMEDLAAEAADMREATRPMTVAQATSGVHGLAALHSRYWNFTDESEPRLAWVQRWTSPTNYEPGMRRCIPLGIERARAVLPEALSDIYGVDELLALWDRYITLLGQGSITLLHGDAHIGNTFVLPSGEVGFLDPTPRRGSWVQDVAYFIVSALAPDDRRSAERDALWSYRAALEVPNKSALSDVAMWTSYRASHIYGLCIWLSTLGRDGWQSEDICRAAVDRYASAFIDHDTAGALHSI